MKKIILFSDSNAPLKHLSTFQKSKIWEIQPQPHSSFREHLKTPAADTLYLIDYASLKEPEKKKTLNYLLKKEDSGTGLIDRNNEITDPAALLFRGTDYIGGKLLKEGISTGRIRNFIDFHSKFAAEKAQEDGVPGTAPAPGGKEYKLCLNGWEGIRSGMEYSFLMLMTEISIPQEWKKKSGTDYLNFIKHTFQTVIERYTAPFDGQIWIWNDYGGLVLFPFNGKSTLPVIAAVKLLMNRVLISVEDFKLHSAVSLRAAMHLGTTAYKHRGKTGTIISDSINSIFHLGTKHTPLNDFDITADVYTLLEPRIKTLFTEAGSYEGRKIYRLKHFGIIE